MEKKEMERDNLRKDERQGEKKRDTETHPE